MTTTRKPTIRLKRLKLENLFRHANGVYDTRLKVNGQSKERGLHTTDHKLAGTLYCQESDSSLRRADG